MSQYHTVANAIRVEVNTDTGEVYLVFRICDEAFKKRIRESWSDNIELELLGKDLVKKE